jgi:hypothetical protein
MHIAAAMEAIALAGSRGVSPSRNASEIRLALLATLKEALPRSLSDVARSLGYKDTERLYQADRKLCHDIAAGYRESGQSHWWKRPGAVRICDKPSASRSKNPKVVVAAGSSMFALPVANSLADNIGDDQGNEAACS